MNKEALYFETKEQFRQWLSEQTGDSGAWLEFRKKGGQKLTAANALEEALCFGWIDGQLESIDDGSYIKYFAPRGKNSKWSEKNKKLAEKLIAEGSMTKAGLEKIEDAKARGCFGNEQRQPITDEIIEKLRQDISCSKLALDNYDSMSKSSRRAYAGDYSSAKTEEGRLKKLARIVERLEMNLNPMESMSKAKANTDMSK